MIAVVLFSCCHCYVKPHNYVGSVLVCCSNFGLIILSTEIFLKGKNYLFLLRQRHLQVSFICAQSTELHR